MTAKIEITVIDRQNLTPREMQIAALLAEGLTDKAIANALAISLSTLANHLEHIYAKLQIRRHAVNTRLAAFAAMVARGMISVRIKTLCIWLMIASAHIDDSAQLNRTPTPMRMPRVQIMRVRVRNKES